MLLASKSLKSLKNPETGLDISVPNVQEVEAPLGGTTVEYEILILTNLANYKSHYHKDEDVVRYSVYRTYREIEDFCDKIEKKFNCSSLPSIPKGREVLKYSSEEKRSSLDTFMQHISKNKEISHSEIFSYFIGITKLKMQAEKLPLQETSTNSENADKKTCSLSAGSTTCAMNNSNVKDGIKNPDLDDRNISELFPKVKVRKASKPDCTVPTEIRENYNANSSLFFEDISKQNFADDDDLDLFEEAKQTPRKEEKESNSNKKSHKGLFGDFMERKEVQSEVLVKNEENLQKSGDINDSVVKEQLLFQTEMKHEEKKSSLLVEKFSSETQVEFKTPQIFSASSKEEQYSELDSHSVIKKKTKDVSLFEEQDFGTAITDEDEKLFFVAKEDESKVTRNPFLSPTSDTSDTGLVESLQDLMNLSDPSIIVSKPEPSSSSDSSNDEVLPRKPPVLSRPASSQKPEIAPKKVPSKPPVPQKPTLLPKPKVPKKPTTVQSAHGNDFGKEEQEVSVNDESSKASKLVDDMADFDIMKYIEQEKKAANEDLNLFD